MTEVEREWESCCNPDALLVHLDRLGGSSRKLRLFCCACVRRVWPLLARFRETRRAVEYAEQFPESESAEAWSARRVTIAHESRAIPDLRKKMPYVPQKDVSTTWWMH